MAERLGVDPCTVRDWEARQHQPSGKSLEVIEKFLENRRQKRTGLFSLRARSTQSLNSALCTGRSQEPQNFALASED